MKSISIAACIKTVITIPIIHHIEDFKLVVYNVDPNAIPVQTALNPNTPFSISRPTARHIIAVQSDKAEATIAHIAEYLFETKSAVIKNSPVTLELIRKTCHITFSQYIISMPNPI